MVRLFRKVQRMGCKERSLASREALLQQEMWELSIPQELRSLEWFLRSDRSMSGQERQDLPSESFSRRVPPARQLLLTKKLRSREWFLPSDELMLGQERRGLPLESFSQRVLSARLQWRWPPSQDRSLRKVQSRHNRRCWPRVSSPGVLPQRVTWWLLKGQYSGCAVASFRQGKSLD
jgi:hypothetical protein